jgi:hypothetical protein
MWWLFGHVGAFSHLPGIISIHFTLPYPWLLAIHSRRQKIFDKEKE